MKILHYPVLYREVIDNLIVDSTENTVLIDSTTGEGGHSALFLEKYPNISVIGLDRDEDIQKKAIQRLEKYKDRFKPVNAWFDDYLKEKEDESANLILFDLGISTFHYEESLRGFSFKKDEKLDMRLDKNQEIDASFIVNNYKEEELANLIYNFGEERYSRRIAKAIVEKRKERDILFSNELAEIISLSVPGEYRRGRIHPATRTFQALRIEVNKELDRIEPALDNAIRVLKKGGRIGVITFHSLEDRKVKWFFKNKEKEELKVIKIITKKPIVPTELEISENSKSRSAKLRIVEKL